jgi:hypothetical protein
VTNRARAEAAKAALNTFTQATYGGRDVDELHEDDQYTAVYDLICDLGHLLRLKRLGELGEAMQRAANHYDHERTLGWDEED